MWMYSREDVEYIVEDFLAEHFGFDSVSLNADAKLRLKNIYYGYGMEVENIKSNLK